MRFIGFSIFKIFLALLCFFAVPVSAWGWQAEVVRVVDGDSLVILRGDNGKKETIRLFGVDCPELGQPFGEEAARLARAVVFGKKVSVVALDVDGYERTVGAVVCLEDGVTLQDELLKAGLAWVDPRYCKGCKLWKALQREAAEEKRGLWGDGEPVAPWKWRKEKREKTRRAGIDAVHRGAP